MNTYTTMNVYNNEYSEMLALSWQFQVPGMRSWNQQTCNTKAPFFTCSRTEALGVGLPLEIDETLK